LATDEDDNAQTLISSLAARGIGLIPDGSTLIARPRERLTEADRERIRRHKADLLALLAAKHEQAESDRIALLDVERREADRQAKRGYDFDPSAPSHIEREEAEIDRLASIDGWRPLPAHSIVATCQRYGVALRIDEATGALVVGRAGAKAHEPSQPWPSLLIAIETHLEAVAALVEEGWSLRADFPQGEVA
jgi:hypothetical protein